MYEAFSAGVQQSKLDIYAIKVMKEIGIDISNQRSKSINEFKDTVFDIVVTVCDNARETCPFFPGKKIIHKSFPNPHGSNGDEETVIENFRRLRDDIKIWIKQEFYKPS